MRSSVSTLVVLGLAVGGAFTWFAYSRQEPSSAPATQHAGAAVDIGALEVPPAVYRGRVVEDVTGDYDCASGNVTRGQPSFLSLPARSSVSLCMNAGGELTLRDALGLRYKVDQDASRGFRLSVGSKGAGVRASGSVDGAGVLTMRWERQSPWHGNYTTSFTCKRRRACGAPAASSVLVRWDDFEQIVNRASSATAPTAPQEKLGGVDQKTMAELRAIVDSAHTHLKQITRPVKVVLLVKRAAEGFLKLADAVAADAGAWQYVRRVVVVDSLESGPVPILAIGQATIINDLVDAAMSNPVANTGLRALGAAGKYLSLVTTGVAVIYGGVRASDKYDPIKQPLDYVFTTAVYAGSELAAGYQGLAALADDGIAAVIGVHTPLSDLADTIGDARAHAESGGCLGLGKFLSCGDKIWTTLSRPFAFVDEINVASNGNTPRINVKLTNHWRFAGGAVYIGASILDGNGSVVCNLPFKSVTLKAQETQQVTLTSSRLAPGTYSVTTKVWYECTPGCEQGTGCLGDGCCHRELAFAGWNATFTVD